MKRYSVFICTSIILLLLFVSSCTIFKPKPQIEQKSPHIRGEITSLITFDNGNTAIQVEGKIEPDTRYAIAGVSITKNTRIYIKDVQGYQIGSQSDLAVGQTVEALFTGPIHTSNPPEAIASEIIVLTSPSQ